jgi:hypothetical protein
VVLCLSVPGSDPAPRASRLGADQDAVGGVTVGESWLGVPWRVGLPPRGGRAASTWLDATATTPSSREGVDGRLTSTTARVLAETERGLEATGEEVEVSGAAEWVRRRRRVG